jgi:hypothetical protein
MVKNDFSEKNIDTSHGRLRRARLAAGFPTAIDAIKRFRWPVSTYRAHDNGQNAFDARTAIRYARAFRVPPTWLLLGETATDGAGAPLLDASLQPETTRIGSCADRRPLLIADGRALRRAPYGIGEYSWFPHLTCHPPARQFALIVEGEFVNRVARDGDAILCVDMAASGAPPSHGDLVLVECPGTDGGEISLRRMRRDGDRIALSFDSDHPDWRETVHVRAAASLAACGVVVIAKALAVFRRLGRRPLVDALPAHEIFAGVSGQFQEDCR